MNEHQRLKLIFPLHRDGKDTQPVCGNRWQPKALGKLIEGQLVQRPLFWSNYDIPDIKVKPDNIHKASIADLQRKHGIDLSKYKLPNKRQVLRNCVDPQLGKHIINVV